MKLTAKQEAFCREYLIDLNGTQAAIRAGYAVRGARTHAARMLANANVQKKIGELQAERAERLEITADRVLQEIARVAFVDPASIVQVDRQGRVRVTPTGELTEGQRRAIQSVSQTAAGLKVRLADKLRALELLARHQGLLVERVQVSGVDEGAMGKLSIEELERLVNGECSGEAGGDGGAAAPESAG